MTASQQLSTESAYRAWRHGNGEKPGWLADAIVGDVQPNGTFLIKTPLGQQRVHCGQVVVEQAGELYAWAAEEVDERVAEIRQRVDARSRAANIVGPGKSLKTAIPRKGGGSRAKASERARAYGPVRGVPPSIEWVLTEDLRVDEDYQRSIDTESSRRLIASIASHWDWRLCMPLAVSRRPDARYVIDGQHRLAAARARTDIAHLPCCIATYEGPSDEAAMFVAANRARRAINRLDDFHAALVAGDEDAIEVNRIVRAAGLKVSRKTGSQSWAPGEVAFTSSIQSVIGKHGDALVISALRAIAQAFEGQVLSNGASVFLGLIRILIAPPTGLDRDRLLRSLQIHDMKQWGAFVVGEKGGDARAQAMKLAIMDAYERAANTGKLAA